MEQETYKWEIVIMISIFKNNICQKGPHGLSKQDLILTQMVFPKVDLGLCFFLNGK